MLIIKENTLSSCKIDMYNFENEAQYTYLCKVHSCSTKCMIFLVAIELCYLVRKFLLPCKSIVAKCLECLTWECQNLNQ